MKDPFDLLYSLPYLIKYYLNRLIGCATFEKSYCRPGEKVIHLTLVAVHKRHRKIGVGHKLIQFIKVNAESINQLVIAMLVPTT